MAIDPAPRANHARYLVVLALGAFLLPLAARILEGLGAPPTPAGVSALLLAAGLITAILLDRPEARGDEEPRSRRAPGRREVRPNGEESDARL